MKNKIIILLLLAIIIFGSAIRLYNPTFRSLWGDELHSLFTAQYFSFVNIIKDSHLPMYFVTLSMWIKYFGISEYSLRFLSILIGIITLILFCVFAYRLFDKKIALISTFFFALSPLAIMHSQEVRMYGLLLMLSIVSSIFWWDIILGNRSRINYLFYLIFTILFCLTHIYSIFFIASQTIFVVFLIVKDRYIKKYLPLLIIQIIILAFMVIVGYVLFSANIQAAMSNSSDMAFSVFPFYAKLFLMLFVISLGETMAPWNILACLVSFVGFGVPFLFALRFIKDKRVLFLYIMVLFSVVVASLIKPTMPKYIIYVLPFYLMIIGYAVISFKSKLSRCMVILCFVAASSFSIYNHFNLKDYHNSNQIEPWRIVAQLIKSQYKTGDIIIASNYFVAFRETQYYLNMLDDNKYTVSSLEKDMIDPNRLEAKRIWLVTQIADERAFPKGFIFGFKKNIEKNYALVNINKYVPYESTLVSKLPIKRHNPGSYRIEVSLYKLN